MNRFESMDFMLEVAESLKGVKGSAIFFYGRYGYIISSHIIGRVEVLKDIKVKDCMKADSNYTLSEVVKLTDAGIDLPISVQDFFKNINNMCMKSSQAAFKVSSEEVVDSINSNYKTPVKASKVNANFNLSMDNKAVLEFTPIKSRTRAMTLKTEISLYETPFFKTKIEADTSSKCNAFPLSVVLEKGVINKKPIIEIVSDNALRVRDRRNGKYNLHWLISSDSIIKDISKGSVE